MRNKRALIGVLVVWVTISFFEVRKDLFRVAGTEICPLHHSLIPISETKFPLLLRTAHKAVVVGKAAFNYYHLGSGIDPIFLQRRNRNYQSLMIALQDGIPSLMLPVNLVGYVVVNLISRGGYVVGSLVHYRNHLSRWNVPTVYEGQDYRFRRKPKGCIFNHYIGSFRDVESFFSSLGST